MKKRYQKKKNNKWSYRYEQIKGKGKKKWSRLNIFNYFLKLFFAKKVKIIIIFLSFFDFIIFNYNYH